eukprot:TRINITY_DN2427_c0_g1_i2.p1 TRINITY_DN2427_c0_g1~~TRINITY_DN2427_c0_g1_i2.p1  ORF type:complete len:531 (+),score=108.05 TRINITY_DN2427_c0_g1_i2:255-1847(+)
MFKLVKIDNPEHKLYMISPDEEYAEWISAYYEEQKNSPLSDHDQDLSENEKEILRRKRKLYLKLKKAGVQIINKKDIVCGKLLGSGSFGKVYKGSCKGNKAAIKVLHQQELGIAELEELVNEVIIMNMLHCRHTLLIMGLCLEPIQIVTELMDCSLDSLYKDTEMDVWDKLILAKECALGLNWLHTSDPMIIHRDIKGQNFLLDSNRRVVIADFGLSESIKKGGMSVDSSGITGTIIFSSPEVLGGMAFSEKADIYSLGLVYWQLFTGTFQHPYSELKPNELVRKVVKENYRPQIPEDLPPDISDLISQMWHEDPEVRPSSSEVLIRLDEIRNNLIVQDTEASTFWTMIGENEEQINFATFLAAFSNSFGDLTRLDKKMLSMLLLKTAKGVGEVTQLAFGHLVAQFGPWNDILVNMRNDVRKSYFFGNTSVRRTRIYLAGEPIGTFILRLCQKYGVMSITYVNEDSRLDQILIKVNILDDMRRMFEVDGKIYEYIDEIIEEYPFLLHPCPQTPFKLFTTELLKPVTPLVI